MTVNQSFKAIKMQEQLYSILIKYITKSNISINKEELKLQLISHPSYPSLHSVTGVLEHIQIPNIAVRLQVNEKIVQQLPTYFIANISSEEGEELVLIHKRNSEIKIIRDHKKIERISYEDFLQQWNGIIVAIEKDETVKEKEKSRFSKLLTWSLPLLAILLIGSFLMTAPDAYSQIHFMLSILGLYISILIVKHDLGLSSEASNSICNISEKTSCEAILNSKAANLFGIFKLSDICISAFSGYVSIWLLFGLVGIENYTPFYFFTLAALPFTLYSLYYQAVVIKKWCPFCLGIVSILGLQGGALLLKENWTNSLAIDQIAFTHFTLGFFIIILIWSSIKPILRKKLALEELELEHYKFKRKFSIFNTLFQNSKSLNSNPSFKGEIVLGNSLAPIEIVVVTSPFCFYCKSAHDDINTILKSAQDKVKVTLRFRVNI